MDEPDVRMKTRRTISVVVPVGPNIEHLPAQLDALSAQAGQHRFELVLSCNAGPVPGLSDLRLPRGVELRVIDSSAVAGPSHARNAGWRAASGELVLFCDADDVASPGWITAMIDGLGDADIVGGMLEFDRLNPPRLGSWGRIAVTGLPSKFSHRAFVPSGNLGVRREALDELGGFDEALPRSEDVDFSWRAIAAGRRLGFAPDAIIHCRRRETFAALFLQGRADAASDPELLKRHAHAGARWTVRDLVREAGGVAAAVVQLPFGSALKLATRLGRFTGHLQRPTMLAIRG